VLILVLVLELELEAELELELVLKFRFVFRFILSVLVVGWLPPDAAMADDVIVVERRKVMAGGVNAAKRPH
jgi:hypothetical protein